MSDNDELDKKLFHAFHGEAPHGASSAQQRRKETVAMFRQKQRRVNLVFGIFFAICLVYMGVGVWIMLSAGRTNTMIWGAVLFLMMYEGTILMKLWYHVATTRLAVTEEVKQLRLDVAELARRFPAPEGGMPAASPDAGAAEEAPRVVPAPLKRTKSLWWAAAELGLVAAAVVVLVAGDRLPGGSWAPFGMKTQGVFAAQPVPIDIPRDWRESAVAYVAIHMEEGVCTMKVVTADGSTFTNSSMGRGYKSFEMPPSSQKLILDPGGNPGTYEAVLAPSWLGLWLTGRFLIYMVLIAIAAGIAFAALTVYLLRGVF